jgi:DNA repair exonuclease SbcCD ATPase subunit
LPGEKDSSTDASDESTPDTEAVTERAQDSEGTDAYLKQFKDDLAERQSVIAQIEALQAEKTAKLAERNALEEKLKAVEKELEAAYEKLKTVWDRPWA